MDSAVLSRRGSLTTVLAVFAAIFVVFGILFAGGGNSFLEFTLSLHSLLNSWIFSVALGLSFGVFTWMITYVDSRCPGVNPPTPMSSWNLRRTAGPSFHVGYALAVLNGLMVFVTSVCYQGLLF